MVMPRETVCMGAPRPYEGARPEVMSSNAGWYIGYRDTDGGPYSRESEYFPTPAAAAKALEDNEWTPRGWPG